MNTSLENAYLLNNKRKRYAFDLTNILIKKFNNTSPQFNNKQYFFLLLNSILFYFINCV